MQSLLVVSSMNFTSIHENIAFPQKIVPLLPGYSLPYKFIILLNWENIEGEKFNTDSKKLQICENLVRGGRVVGIHPHKATIQPGIFSTQDDSHIFFIFDYSLLVMPRLKNELRVTRRVDHQPSARDVCITRQEERHGLQLQTL